MSSNAGRIAKMFLMVLVRQVNLLPDTADTNPFDRKITSETNVR